MARPSVLFPLFARVTTLKGVGDAAHAALKRLLISRNGWSGESASPVIRDLLFHRPSGVTDRRTVYAVADAPIDKVATMIVTVQTHHPAPPRGGRRSPHRVVCSDESGELMLTFFRGKTSYLQHALPEGQQRIISGVIELYDGVRQMAHPDVIARVEEREKVARLEANYPLTYALHAGTLRKLIAQSLTKLPDLPEWLDPQMKRQREWLDFAAALRQMHLPQSLADVAEDSPLRERLAYDELLANQLALAMVRERGKRKAGIRIADSGTLRDRLIASLPFALTDGQCAVLAEMDADLASGYRMMRLLQGDVGSGKTVVALLALLPMIEAGYQAAVMVPTEVLGRQHVQSMTRMLEPLGVKVAMLSGKMKAADKRELLQQLASGEVQLAVGTHALFQDAVEFANLGMVVIDEQHRFGVNQRLALSSKGAQPHVLLMTATPIPRSLTMTAYGDMDASLLREKPAYRQAIDTRAVPLSRIEDVVAGVQRAVKDGAKVYWICPLVEEAEEGSVPKEDEGDLTAAEERYRVLNALMGERVALAHGQMKVDDRDAAMQRFAGDGADVLVATTVVEVGVDVPEATIIVIEHAERFGLAQLHQLRGRVGRGDKASSCILLYSPRCSEVATKRLKMIRESQDGFAIAEEDLLLRGAGDVLGTRQSGLPDFHFADLLQHRELLLAARDDVKLIVHRDAALNSERGEALRVLLYLFGYDESLRFLEAG